MSTRLEYNGNFPFALVGYQTGYSQFDAMRLFGYNSPHNQRAPMPGTGILLLGIRDKKSLLGMGFALSSRVIRY